MATFFNNLNETPDIQRSNCLLIRFLNCLFLLNSYSLSVNTKINLNSSKNSFKTVQFIYFFLVTPFCVVARRLRANTQWILLRSNICIFVYKLKVVFILKLKSGCRVNKH